MIELDITTKQRLSRHLQAGILMWTAIIEASPGEAFFVCNSNRAANINGIMFRPWPIAPAEISDGGDGDLVGTTLSLSNVWRLVMPFLESGSWDQGRVIIELAYRVTVSEDAAPGSDPFNFQMTGLRWDFRMQDVVVNNKAVALGLGQPNFLEMPFPRERYLRGEKYPALPRNQ